MSINSPSDARVIAVFGPPGAGKTTVAMALASTLEMGYVASGDIARRVDPGAISRGEMADRGALRDAFVEALLGAQQTYARVVVDGLPRDPGDVAMLPPDALFILLSARPDILMDRQRYRGRPGDDAGLIIRRTTEQRLLMELDVKDGWAYRLAGWKSTLNTGDKTREQVVGQALGWVSGERKTIG